MDIKQCLADDPLKKTKGKKKAAPNTQGEPAGIHSPVLEPAVPDALVEVTDPTQPKRKRNKKKKKSGASADNVPPSSVIKESVEANPPKLVPTDRTEGSGQNKKKKRNNTGTLIDHRNVKAESDSSPSMNASQKIVNKKQTTEATGSSREPQATSTELVLSPGVQKVQQGNTSWSCTSEKDIENFFSCFGAQNNKSDLATRLQTVNAHLGLDSKDIELLKSTRQLGPVYASSSFSNSVTVTCSSSSSQLSTDRLHNLHLFGVNSVSPLTNSVVASEMNPTQDLKKSREEVEAERKLRKAAKEAAKQAAKEKAKGGGDVIAAKDKDPKNAEPGTKKKEVTESRSNNKKGVEMVARKQVDKVSDQLQNLHLVGGSRAADEPDFARVVSSSKDEAERIIMAAKEAVQAPRKGIVSKEMQTSMKGNVAKAVEPSLKKGDTEKPMVQVPAKGDGEKSKAELRAERRAKQEAQRAAKTQQQLEQQQKQKQPSASTPQSKQPPKAGSPIKPVSTKAAKDMKDVKVSEHTVKLFSHLYQNSFRSISRSVGVSHPQHHPAIVRLGVQYAERVVLGSNARCVALLYALKEVIDDYITPPQKEFSRGLEAHLQPNTDFLQRCRPLSVSMVNAMRHIKWQLTQLPNSITDGEARQRLKDAIDLYIDEQIEKAAQAIGDAVSAKITDGDVILVYACSSLVLRALSVAHANKRKFRVIVVDSLPWLEGREMLRRLVALGVQCSYVHISAASFVMREVSKVLLGAHALLANGYVMSRVGSSQVALLAHSYNVPVLVCCETHKFSERVQTDSFVYNELGNPDELIGARRSGEREAERERPLSNWRDLPKLSLLNLVYDVTPPDLVTAVVTERAILPCTSVPVILRIKPTEC